VNNFRMRRRRCRWGSSKERLVVCRNPLLAFSRARKREELLQATEKNLAKIRDAVPAAPGWDQDTEPTPLQKKILDLLDSLPNQ